MTRKVDWPQAYFTSEVEGLRYAPAHLITARSKACENAYELVLDSAEHTAFLSDDQLAERVKLAVERTGIMVQPFVEIDGMDITVCLDRKEVDAEFVNEALDKILEYFPQGNGRHYFGLAKVYRTVDMPWL